MISHRANTQVHTGASLPWVPLARCAQPIIRESASHGSARRFRDNLLLCLRAIRPPPEKSWLPNNLLVSQLGSEAMSLAEHCTVIQNRQSHSALQIWGTGQGRCDQEEKAELGKLSESIFQVFVWPPFFWQLFEISRSHTLLLEFRFQNIGLSLFC